MLIQFSTLHILFRIKLPQFGKPDIAEEYPVTTSTIDNKNPTVRTGATLPACATGVLHRARTMNFTEQNYDAGSLTAKITGPIVIHMAMGQY